MNNARFMFLIALVFLGSMLWTRYAEEHAAAVAAQQPAAPAGTAATPAEAIPGETPAAAPVDPAATEVPDAPAAIPSMAALPSGAKITVQTDLVDAEIDLLGGDFSRYALKRYIKGTDPKPDDPVVLFDSTPEKRFRAQSGWSGGTDNPLSHEKAVYAASGEAFVMAEGQNTLEVPLTLSADGLTVRKIYQFERGSYAIKVRYELSNTGAADWSGAPYRLIHRLPVPTPSGFFVSNPETFSFAGAAVYSPAERFRKLHFDNFASEPYSSSFSGGWSAMVQHHFIAAWLPPAEETVAYSSWRRP
jgi:YidC/Oxa1 family membrane protein insertase